jgi:salicylate biosynthesis isochorismate synthase
VSDPGRTSLAAALEQADPGAVVVATVPAAPAPLRALLDAVADPAATVWRTPGGLAFAGVGTAAELAADGDDRCAALRDRTRSVFARLRPVAGAARPRMFGGLSFAPGGARQRPWQAFGDAALVLHRWAYERRGGEASLTLAVDLADPARPADAELLAEYEHIGAALEAAEGASPDEPPEGELVDMPARDLRQMPLTAWIAHVRRIQAALASGEFEKLVATRRCIATLGEGVEPLGVLARLASDYPDCTGFLFRRGGASLVGATPETLFSVRGREVRSQALAGSLVAGSDPAATTRQRAMLARSRKNLGEHEVVVREILEALREHCVDLGEPPPPEVVQVRTLLHLSTPIVGELAPDVHPLDIVASLHPTPAMGGIPRQKAVDWITHHEPVERGWYTGPVGWIDACGDCDLKVAIRCGVLDGDSAYVYTGAGIVPASKPAAEYHETALKQQPVLRALRLRG